MPLLYRSPTVVVDRHEWHITVSQEPRSKRVCTIFRFRRAGVIEMWRPITSWQGRKPKALGSFFERYQLSIADARSYAAGGGQVSRTEQRSTPPQLRVDSQHVN